LDPDAINSLRSGYSDVILNDHLQQALVQINPQLPLSCIQQAIKEVERVNTHGDLVACNEYFQNLLINGVDVSFLHQGEEKTVKVWLVDSIHPENNHWVVSHQMTIIENGQNKRPDVLVFLNGMPIVVMELKNAVDANATIDKAYQQLKTYHQTIPSLFCYNVLEVISDGLEARVGTITSDSSRFMTWKTADGQTHASSKVSQLEVLVEGMMQKDVLLDLSLNFIVFERSKSEDLETKTIQIGVVKKIAAYHQYYAVKKAVVSTALAIEKHTQKGGVVWHTQGSGKSLSMVFYTGLLVKSLNSHCDHRQE
jgi:type I restriction enzyme R subunit